jgi:hypothetical protein
VKGFGWDALHLIGFTGTLTFVLLSSWLLKLFVAATGRGAPFQTVQLRQGL